MRSCTTLQDSLFAHWDDVYASAIFEKTRPLVEELKRVFPKAIVGGTGSGSASRLEEIGVSGFEQDYSLYPRYAFSIGFTQRGCRLRCPFCVVPWKEGKVKPAQSIYEIWRGDPWPRYLVLLDNDFFGQTGWREMWVLMDYPVPVGCTKLILPPPARPASSRKRDYFGIPCVIPGCICVQWTTRMLRCLPNAGKNYPVM